MEHYCFSDVTNVWLGARYHHSLHHWLWVNGVGIPKTDSRWNLDGEKGHRCMTLVGDKYWSQNCDVSYASLCEKKISIQSRLTNS